MIYWGSSYVAVSANTDSGNRRLSFFLTELNVCPHKTKFIMFSFFPTKENLNFYSRLICLNVIICIYVANELIIL